MGSTPHSSSDDMTSISAAHVKAARPSLRCPLPPPQSRASGWSGRPSRPLRGPPSSRRITRTAEVTARCSWLCSTQRRKRMSAWRHSTCFVRNSCVHTAFTSPCTASLTTNPQRILLLLPRMLPSRHTTATPQLPPLTTLKLLLRHRSPTNADLVMLTPAPAPRPPPRLNPLPLPRRLPHPHPLPGPRGLRH